MYIYNQIKENKMKRFYSFIITGLPVLILLTGISTGFSQTSGFPPVEEQAMEVLNNSPRHGEWVTIDAGNGDMVDTWFVYPERSDNAPVVIVIHEIYGLTDWIRVVADQLAAEGFIAVAPDLLTGKGPGGRGTSSVTRDEARSLIRALVWDEIVSRLDAVAKYATGLPAATGKFGTVGFCWGGGTSYLYAAEQPGLDAAVVYYGVSPAKERLSDIKAPVLGLYGGDDNRVNSTIPDAEKEMRRLGKRYEYELYDGAGHAFLRNQNGREGANLKAAQNAWPRMVKFLNEELEN
jgi:carboxymethylenebutenolidase